MQLELYTAPQSRNGQIISQGWTYQRGFDSYGPESMGMGANPQLCAWLQQQVDQRREVGYWLVWDRPLNKWRFGCYGHGLTQGPPCVIHYKNDMTTTAPGVGP